VVDKRRKVLEVLAAHVHYDDDDEMDWDPSLLLNTQLEKVKDGCKMFIIMKNNSKLDDLYRCITSLLSRKMLYILLTFLWRSFFIYLSSRRQQKNSTTRPYEI
jgi:hypothetical protein